MKTLTKILATALISAAPLLTGCLESDATVARYTNDRGTSMEIVDYDQDGSADRVMYFLAGDRTPRFLDSLQSPTKTPAGTGMKYPPLQSMDESTQTAVDEALEIITNNDQPYNSEQKRSLEYAAQRVTEEQYGPNWLPN